jgi:hypothetical protein
VSKQSPNAASNSFTRAELKPFVELCRRARLIPGLKILMRSEGMVSLERKCLRMLENIEGRSNGAPATQKDGP